MGVTGSIAWQGKYPVCVWIDMPSNNSNRPGFIECKCPMCGETVHSHYIQTRDHNWGYPGVFFYVKCSECGLIRQSPRPGDECLGDIYPENYGTSLLDYDTDPDMKINTPLHQYRVSAIERYVPQPGLIYDIGSGSGFFLAYMVRRGWSAAGVEVAEEHVEYARVKLGLDKVSCGMWPLPETPDLDVDAISIIHVLEHLPDPVESLQRAKDLLKPQGIILIETPNIRSLAVRLFGAYCTSFDAPRHLCLFDPSTLIRCVEAAGLEVLDVRTYSPSITEYTESLRYWLIRKGAKQSEEEQEGGGVDISTNSANMKSGRKIWQFVLDIFHAGEMVFFRSFDSLVGRFSGRCNILLVARKC